MRDARCRVHRHRIAQSELQTALFSECQVYWRKTSTEIITMTVCRALAGSGPMQIA